MTTSADARAAALAYMRRVTGVARPNPADAEAFESAMWAIAQATQDIMEHYAAAAERREAADARLCDARTAVG